MRFAGAGCVLLLGCGRLGFDATIDRDSGTTDDDAPALLAPCVTGTTPAANVIIAGETFRYIDFNNNSSALPFAGATALALDHTTVLANTITFADSSYALAIPTNGAPVRAVLAYSLAAYWTTWIESDRPYDTDIAGPNAMRWRIGDGPLWNDGAMVSIYNTLGAVVDTSKAFLAVSVRDCAGGIIEGVSFDIDPPPLVSGYLNGSGLPGVNTSTLAPHAQFVAFNVEPVRTRIRPTKAGLQFVDFELDVQAGENVNYVVVHPTQ